MANENNAAFPIFPDTGCPREGFEGLTKLEYFTAMAMTGYIAHGHKESTKDLATWSVRAAKDALREIENAN